MLIMFHCLFLCLLIARLKVTYSYSYWSLFFLSHFLKLLLLWCTDSGLEHRLRYSKNRITVFKLCFVCSIFLYLTLSGDFLSYVSNLAYVWVTSVSRLCTARQLLADSEFSITMKNAMKKLQDLKDIAFTASPISLLM